MISFEVTFGPTHRAELDAGLGENLSEARVIDTCIYMTPHYETYQLPSGRIAQMIEKSFSTLVYIFDGQHAYKVAQDARWSSMRDPEASRVV